MPARQRGAALILALLVVILVALLATASGSDFLVTFRRAENQLYGQQAYAQLLAAEGIARAALLADLRDPATTDSLSEPWAEPLQFPTEQGVIAGRIYNLEGRLNLSTLAQQPGTEQRYGVDQLRFIRLLQVLPLEEPLDPVQAEELANAVFDWLDADDNERAPGGAESLYYNSLEPPLRPPAGRIASISELRWVKGMSAEIYNLLAPHLSLWPATGANININTASLEVLRSLNADSLLEPLAEVDAQAILDERERLGALEDLSIFASGALQGRDINTNGLGFTGQYFLLAAETVFLSRLYRLNSLIHRDPATNTALVIARSQGSL